MVARVPAAVRETLQAAADLYGATLNQFIVQVAYREAQQVLERESVIRLNRAQAKQVFALMENPPKPNAALRAAGKKLKRDVRL